MAIAKHKTRRRELRESRALARRVQRGDRRAFELLYASYEGGLFRFCHRLTGSTDAAAALVEATFARALATLPAQGLDTVDVGAHLHATARSLSYARHDDGHANGNGNGNGDGWSPRAAQGEHASEVAAANARLAPRQRMALALRDLEGRPDDEIALALGAEPPAVPALVARARLRLRAELALPAAVAGCDGSLADLSAYADGTLPGERRAAVEAHLEECADCRAALFALQEAAQRYRAVPVPLPPGELSARMATALEAVGLPTRRTAAAAAAGAAAADPAVARGGRQTAAAVAMAVIVIVGAIVTLLARDEGGGHKGSAAPKVTRPAAPSPATTTHATAPTTTTVAAAAGGRVAHRPAPPRLRHARSGTLHFPHASTPVTPVRTSGVTAQSSTPRSTASTQTEAQTPAAPSSGGRPPQPLKAPAAQHQIPVQILPPSPPAQPPAPANASPPAPSASEPAQTTST